jgi:FixJ family two-component response regulator
MRDPNQLLCYLIDDERAQVERLSRMIKLVCSKWVVHEFTTPKLFINQISNQNKGLYYFEISDQNHGRSFYKVILN